VNATAAGLTPGRVPPDLARRLGVVEREASALGQRVWWAGGGVRDLLLDRLGAGSDLDLVLEADPLDLATSLRAALGGRLTEHPGFLTVTLEVSSGERIDLARARREIYPRPGALPIVEPAPLEQDLRRRDFTINALALPVGMAPESAIDPFGGRDDLGSGRLRVLHEESFRDDPTRILRGVRFEARFGFRFEASTEDLARVAIRSGALRTLSGDRLRRELDLAFEDWSRAGSVLRRLLDLGVAQALGTNGPEPEALDAIERAGELAGSLDWGGGSRAPSPWQVVRLPLLLGADRRHSGELFEKLVGPSERAGMEGIEARSSRAAELLGASGLRPSEVAVVLDALGPPELLWLAARLGESAAERIGRYLAQHRHLRLAIGGRELLDAGLREGPAVGRVLEATRRARIDGEIGADEELSFALGRARPAGRT